MSESAAEKLFHQGTVHRSTQLFSIVGRYEMAGVGETAPGKPIVRGWLDAHALHCSGESPWEDQDGWCEVSVQSPRIPPDGTVKEIKFLPENSLDYKGTVHAKILIARPLCVGDKLGTMHGIKGIVSRILPDLEMPIVNGEHAEIVLNPNGVEKRDAMGQLIEMGISTPQKTGIHGGMAKFVRLRHDAKLACCAYGASNKRQKGYRFGEMEFWALMAHNAPAIAE